MWTYVGCERSRRGPALRLRYRFVNSERVWQKHAGCEMDVNYETIPRVALRLHEAATGLLDPYLVIEPGGILMVYGWLPDVPKEDIDRVNNDQKNRSDDERERRMFEATVQLEAIKRDFPELLN